MIPRFEPPLGWRELAMALTPAPRDAVETLESHFAKQMGAKHAVAFPYGRTALALLLEALGIDGREVICPAYTCVVVPHAIVASGNEPVFIDSQEYDFNMNLDLVDRAISPNTAAIVATSIFGYPVDLDHLQDIGNRYPHVHVIQDCAHSFDASWNGRPVQAAGIAAVFGLNISKIITTIFGGMLTTDCQELAEKLRQLRDQRLTTANRLKPWRRRLYLIAVYFAFRRSIYGLTNAMERYRVLDRFTKYYDEALIDMPADHLVAMCPFEAQVGICQLRRYRDIIDHRRMVAQFYDDQLREIAGILRPPLVDGATYSHYVVRADQRDRIVDFGIRRGIHFGQIIDYNIPDMPAYQGRPGNRYSYPVARDAARSALNLSTSTDAHAAAATVRVVKDFATNSARAKEHGKTSLAESRNP